MSAPRVTPLSQKRSKGRPNRLAQLTINAERSRYKARQKLVDLEETAVDELKKMLEEKDIPAQVKLGAIKQTLQLCDELYQELVVQEQAYEDDQSENQEEVVEDVKPTFTVITAEFKG